MVSLGTFKLSDIAEISIGKTPSRSNPRFWDKEKKTDNVWLSIRDLSKLDDIYVSDSREYVSDEGAKLFKEVPKNTLIMSFKLSIGRLAITQRNLRTNEAIASFVIKDPSITFNNFLLYYLSRINWETIAGDDIKVKGMTLNKAKLKEFPVVLPPLSEQERIVKRLDKSFDKINIAIKSTEQKLKYLDNLKSAILKKDIKTEV